MIIDIDEISKQWKLDEPQLDILGQQVVSLLKKGLFAVELHPEISYRTKEIQSIIKKIQKKQKEKTYGYNDLRDRLVTQGLEDVHNRFNARRVSAEHGKLFERIMEDEGHYFGRWFRHTPLSIDKGNK